MRWKGKLGLGLVLALGGPAAASAQYQAIITGNSATPAMAAPAATSAPTIVAQAPEAATPAPAAAPTPPIAGNMPDTRGEIIAAEQGTAPPGDAPWGPTPLTKVGILDGLIYGDGAEKAPIHFAGWLDADYTYRSTGRGQNNVAPVENRFGDEFLMREIGLYIYKPLDPNCLSWGFNALFLAGSDASFISPTAGGWRNSDPRFGTQFTDLNLTAHLPILSEGGVDLKVGRQTTCLGPMGAIAWQRTFDSSDYAWYNMEEGRYTGVSAVWHVTKRLDWYSGIEFGWGTFYDVIGPAPQFLNQVSYWLDEEAKNTKVWATTLVGPTGMISTGNTTVLELGVQHNWNKYVYQIVDTQMVWSRAPIFGAKPPGYQENAYDVYTYLGAHINACWDINSRFEWYYDQNGGGYPGGFGKPNTSYYEVTLGPDYHPVKWLQFRPEVRYDFANHDNFGRNYNKRDQLSLAAEILIKF